MPRSHNLVLRKPGNLRFGCKSRTLVKTACSVKEFPVQIRVVAYFHVAKIIHLDLITGLETKLRTPGSNPGRGVFFIERVARAHVEVMNRLKY